MGRYAVIHIGIDINADVSAQLDDIRITSVKTAESSVFQQFECTNM